MKARLFAPRTGSGGRSLAVAFGLFMIMLDNTVVNVALPSIQRDLGIDALGARVGRRRLRAHVRGAACSRAASSPTCSAGGGSSSSASSSSRSSSLACGLAASASVLIGARVVQGVGAALMNPATLSIITRDVPAAPARDGDRDLGRRLGDRARDRAARRRRHHGAPQLELDLLHQRADRRPRASPPRPDRSTSRATPHTSSGSTCPGLRHVRRSGSSRSPTA